MEEQLPARRTSWRPQFSLLTAILLMTIICLTIGVAQLWHEVGPLRREVISLRNEVGRLSIDDRSKIHAIQMRTDEDLTWKWRLWIPDGKQVVVHMQCGDVPRTGVPAPRNTCSLGPGEQTFTFKVHQNRSGKSWFASLESTIGGGVGTSISPDQEWFNWGQAVSTNEGAGLSTVAYEPSQKTIVLSRTRAGKFSSSLQLEKIAGPTAGFIIWMDQR
jgi:hypothetical protein